MYTNRRKPRHGTKAWMSYIRGLKKNSGGRRKRSRPRHNMYSAGEIANPRRTRTITRYVRVKRNPPKRGAAGFLGLAMPGIEPIAGTFAGLAVPPLLNYLVKPYLPASLTSSKLGTYAIQAAEVILPSIVVKKFVNRNVGNYMLVVGIGKLLYDAAQDVAPQVFGLKGMGYQSMLGVYPQARAGFPRLPAVPQMQTKMIQGTPDRLNPMARY